MSVQFYQPSELLRPYVKNYWISNTEDDTEVNILYPSGMLYLAVRISAEGNLITEVNNQFIAMPSVEVFGQITSVARIHATKGNVSLIATLYPHSSSLFFPTPISEFTNDSIDLADVIGQESNELFEQMMAIESYEEKVCTFDAFMIRQLIRNQKRSKQVMILEEICNQVIAPEELGNSVKYLSGKYGFSERYIQKLFMGNVGLTPKSYFNIQRFNRSLELIRKKEMSLTSIAYDCGYFDQAHFIKEFRKFTGITPSEARQMAI